MKKILALFLSVLLLFGIVATVSSGEFASNLLSGGSWLWSHIHSGELPTADDFSGPAAARAQPPERVEDDAAVAAGVYRRLPVFSPAASEHYPYRAQTLGYQCLESDAQRACYRQLEEQVYVVSGRKGENGCFSLGTVVLPGVKLSEGEIRVALSAFTADHPEIFWLANLFGYAYDDGDTQVRLYSQLSYSTCADGLSRLEETLDAFAQEVPAGLGEFDRELLAHDWLLSHCAYDDAAVTDNTRWQAFTVYGALLEGSAVCEGYSRALSLLLSLVDMESTQVNGVAKDTPHMWNLVMVDGLWYHLDATWNDSDKMRRYDYFNLTDALISADHTADPPVSTLSEREICGGGGAPSPYNLPLPASLSLEANYFTREAIEIDSLGAETDAAVIEKLLDCARSGEESVSFRLGEGLDYHKTIEQLFHRPPYKFSYYAQQVNRQLPMECQLDLSRAVYAEVEPFRSVTVQLAYHPVVE